MTVPNTCIRCGQPALFVGAGGLCSSCWEKAIRDPEESFICECGNAFFRPTLKEYDDSRAQGICPYCGRKWTSEQ